MVELVNIVGSMVRIQLKIMIFFSKFTDFNRFILSKRSISFLISENAISQKKKTLIRYQRQTSLKSNQHRERSQKN